MRNRKEENLTFLRLLHKNQKKGWTLFLEQYSQDILQTIRRCCFDYDECMEIYVYVCEKLSENNCSKLKQFRGEGKYGRSYFSTWLVTTTINFCRAWVRQKKGRRRLFESIKELPKLDQTVFELYYWQGYQATEILELLKIEYSPSLTPLDIHQSLQRLNQALSEKNKWKIVSTLLRNQPDLSIEKLTEEYGDKFESKRSTDFNENPESAFENQYAESLIRAAFQTLSADEQRLLRLRFEKGLSARRIGQLLKISRYKIVYSKIENATEKIRSYLQQKGYHAGDCNFQESNFEIFQ